ncbi:MAG: RAMP superfamily CRISPR-associated protein [Thalassobaculaceae bacterium]
MHLGKVVITGELEVLAPLHVGRGARLTDTEIKTQVSAHAGEASESIQFSAIQRDHEGMPYIPATSLKGSLRAVFDGGERLRDLFGEISDSGKETGARTGVMGRLWFDGASCIAALGGKNLEALPYGGRGGLKGTFVKPRTRIDRRTGTADRHRLFHAEMVPARTRFAFSAIWLTDMDAGGIADELQSVVAALAPLVAEEGHALGRGTQKGDGRVRMLAETLSLTYSSVLVDGGLDQAELTREFVRQLTGTAAAKPRKLVRLRLACDGPFISIDSSRRTRGGRDGGQNNLIAPLRDADGRPLLWASSVLGALRERCAWIAECDRLAKQASGGGDAVSAFAPARDAGAPIDDRDLGAVFPAARAVRKPEDLAALSSVERLFGVTGWKARVAVAAMRCVQSGGSKKLTNVSIDRFTGGARDSARGGALFDTEVWFDPVFEVDLELDESRGGIAAADLDLFDRLIEEVTAEGLFLGHGSAKGYGWFDVGASRDISKGDGA